MLTPLHLLTPPTYKHAATTRLLPRHQVWKEVTYLPFLWVPHCSKISRLPLSLCHTRTHTMNSSSSCIYLFFVSASYLWEIKSVSLRGWLGRTSNSTAQARAAPDWESRKEDIYHHKTHQLYRHALCSFSHLPLFPSLLLFILKGPHSLASSSSYF